GRDPGSAQQACASARSHPGGGGAGFVGGGGDGDVAAEADDVVEIQLLGQHSVELLVAEAAVSDNAYLDVGRSGLRPPDSFMPYRNEGMSEPPTPICYTAA